MSTNERPILFSGPMVRAILDGRKTETRRVMKPQPHCTFGSEYPPLWGPGKKAMGWANGGGGRWHPDWLEHCPYGQPGDLLYVRETWAEAATLRKGEWSDSIVYRADHGDINTDGWGWRPSIHMPKWCARIWLRVTDVRVERVQDITEEGARAEGTTRGPWPEDCGPDDYVAGVEHGYTPPMSYLAGFATLWDSLNADRGYGWDENPWVWVVTFERTDDA